MSSKAKLGDFRRYLGLTSEEKRRYHDQEFRERIQHPDASEMRRDYYGWFLPALTDAQLRQIAPRRIRDICDDLGITGNISPGEKIAAVPWKEEQ